MLDKVIGIEIEGKEVCPTCVIGSVEPSPTMMRRSVVTGVKEARYQDEQTCEPWPRCPCTNHRLQCSCSV